ncbi:hypothetical protein AB0D38_26925 [Streptomyces sp. NPDC048279]|uniref:hypothetical protein n=1 Tax=unclassified Streptomyces TaxID=2593676 RepID=UPI00341A8A01
MHFDADARRALAARAAELEAHAFVLGEALDMLDADMRATAERLARLRGTEYSGQDDATPMRDDLKNSPE